VTLYTVLKKIAAILLIVILSFNWYGYRIVTNILTKNADQRLEAQLDNNDYDDHNWSVKFLEYALQTTRLNLKDTTENGTGGKYYPT
jgi:hypothetical protein